MATLPVFDMEPLLASVSDAQPAGPDLRTASGKERDSYHAVRDARKKAADAERRLREFALLTDKEREAEPSVPDPADWDAVCDRAIEALTRSKDLWITAWLIEGLTRQHGFAGLRDGFGLAREFCKGFWKDLHPQDLPARFAQLAGLNGTDSDGTLIAAMRNVPVIAPKSMRPLSLADYGDAVELDRKDPTTRARRVEQGAVTIEMFNSAIAEARVNDLQDVLDDLQQAFDTYVSFNTLLGETVPDRSLLPPSSRIRDTLDDCLRTFRVLTQDVLAKPGQNMDPGSGGEPEGTATGSSKKPFPSGVDTRQDALQTLMRVAQYFRQTEPHSPISYALEQAVRWARLPLPELLSELVADKSAREEIFKRAGIAPLKEDNE